MSEYMIIEPKIAEPGCLTTFSHVDNYKDLQEIEKLEGKQRFIARAYLDDNMPLSGNIEDVISRPSFHQFHLNQEIFEIFINYGRGKAIFVDLVADGNGCLKYLQIEVEAECPLMVFDSARTVFNEFLDNFQKNPDWWLPIVLTRIDLHFKNDERLLAQQLIMPYPNSIKLCSLGGLHQFPAFSFYASLQRETINASSPYYRFLCAYRLYEGINRLSFLKLGTLIVM